MRARKNPPMARIHRFILIMPLAVALAGCSLPHDKSEPPQAYLLEAGHYAPPTARRATGQILLITEPKVAAGFNSNRIAYTKEPLKLDYYIQNVWSDTPGKMLLPILVRAFEGTGAFKAVISPPSPTMADLRIDVDVIRLQQEFIPQQPSRVRFAARIKVLSMKDRQVLGTQVFEVVEPAPSEDAYGAARAANLALEKLLSDMVPFALRL